VTGATGSERRCRRQRGKLLPERGTCYRPKAVFSSRRSTRARGCLGTAAADARGYRGDLRALWRGDRSGWLWGRSARGRTGEAGLRRGIVWNRMFQGVRRLLEFRLPRVPAVPRADQAKVERGVKYFRRNFLPGRTFVDLVDSQETQLSTSAGRRTLSMYRSTRTTRQGMQAAVKAFLQTCLPVAFPRSCTPPCAAN